MRLRGALGTALALCLAATGCASARTAEPGAAQSSPVAQDTDAKDLVVPDYEAQAKANRTRAEGDARLLLALAKVPPGSVELALAPAALSAPALGSTVSDQNVDLATYWRVPLSFPAAEAYLKQHPPAGLREFGSSSGGSLAAKSHGWGWSGGGSGSPDGQLHIGLASVGDGSAASAASYLRVDAFTHWVDPRPIRDKAAGARMRIEAGDRCPAKKQGMVGVRNDGRDLDHALAPADEPSAGLLCAYGGLNDTPPLALSLERVLAAADAARVAEAAHRVTLSHYDAMRSCAMHDGSVTVLVLQYPNRPAVNLWLPSASCHGTSNGHIVATDLLSLGALRDVVTALSR
ncbi:MAG TPA: hypothetical protein VGB75_12900 [Jatrophihabitans sp.]|jgi:hypothetical protein|uniref:hypothetical protein n=1 Tax=Jatrophihabitans sp. TaxID=1932789 RepID=UPI002EEA8E33